MSIFMFALGTAALQLQPELPTAVTVVWVAAALAAAVGLAAVLRGRGRAARLSLMAAAALAGFIGAALRADDRLADVLPMAWEGRDVPMVGVIDDLPQSFGEGVRFTLAVESAEGPVPSRVQVSWYRGRDDDSPLPRLLPGERWAFTLRLKRPHGFVNPAGFDYEAWLLERGVRATGYVRAQPAPRRLHEDAGGWMTRVHRVRAAVRDRFLAALGEAPYAGILVALAVGDQRAIPAEQWEVFRRTGIAHLVSISGMHISLIALLAGGLVNLLWRRVPALVLRLPARKAGVLAGLAAALGYGLLAGMGIPVQRAAIMLSMAAIALMLGREVAPSRVLALAVLGVLLVDPWAVLAAGFWLSFGAVGAILVLAGGRIGPAARWSAAVRLQLGITLATVPLLVALFHSFPLVSPLANAVAIPLVSFVVTPLALLAMVLPWDLLLEAAHWVTARVMDWSVLLADLPFALWRQAAAPGWALAAGAVGAWMWLLPRPLPGRAGALLMVGLLLGWQPPRPAPGSFRATVLDVGNGLAVHVQTATHDLLYDAGPPYGPLSDAGERVVLPYLAANGVARLDALVLSHDDADHSGGAGSVLESIAVDEVLAGEGAGFVPAAGVPARACAAGEQWAWDDVGFQVLHPVAGRGPARRNNDDSCVLRIAAGGGSLLLVGDIEQRAEAGLVRGDAAVLASSVIVVAHHGSRSSSSPAFVDAVLPEAAVFSVGYRNMFGHPHPMVWARWAEAGARNWRTDSQGAIAIEVDGSGVTVNAARESAPRYWHGR
ncbi:DNA internalization-related competence protein ComEC/Rec2 [Azoarcus olearius]|uniref:DNA internalization-related competence protein ComEC/Rec2 n=1 Tax=Azoarcus sp. (strain BH72) TaxID=418699 RepID=UPI000AC7FC6A